MKIVVSGLVALSAALFSTVSFSEASSKPREAGNRERVCTLVRWPTGLGAAPVFACKEVQVPRHRSRVRRPVSPRGR
jgi:hypothetical protein